MRTTTPCQSNHGKEAAETEQKGCGLGHGRVELEVAGIVAVHLCPHLFPVVYEGVLATFWGHFFVQSGVAGGPAEACPTLLPAGGEFSEGVKGGEKGKAEQT